MHSSPSPEQVRNASPEDLVLMLFEGALRFGHQAQQALNDGDRATGAGLVARVRSIVEELEYVLRRLEPDTIDATTLGEVISDLQVLCEAWTALVAERRLEESQATSPALA